MKYLAFYDAGTRDRFDRSGATYTIMEFADHETMQTFLFLSSRKPVKWEEIKKTDHIRFEKYTDDSDTYLLNEDKVNELRGL
jgi:hypothetical protein